MFECVDEMTLIAESRFGGDVDYGCRGAFQQFPCSIEPKAQGVSGRSFLEGFLEKCLFYCHDLSGYVFCDRLVAWNLALGYGFNVDVSGSFLEDAARQDWCAYVQDLQKRVASRIALQPLRAWRHERPVTLRREDDGVVVAKWGEVDVTVNLGDMSREIGGHRLAPYGYFISAPGLVARYLDGGKPEIITEKSGE